MIGAWTNPGRIEAHRLLRLEVPLALLPATAAPQAELPVRTVDEVFYRGLVPDVLNAPSNEINTRLDALVDRLPLFGLGRQESHERLVAFAEATNRRRRVRDPFLGMTLQGARDFLTTDLGAYLLLPLPFEDRARGNDRYEALYVRDSGLHRRLIEQSAAIPSDLLDRACRNGGSVEELRQQRLNGFVGPRWESFVVVSIIDLVDERCRAFAYRHEERDEIDLILEWRDSSPPERWAIEVAGRKFGHHPSNHFAGSCDYLGVVENGRFLVFRDDSCSGNARGRGGVPALTLPRMFERLKTRMRQSTFAS